MNILQKSFNSVSEAPALWLLVVIMVLSLGPLTADIIWGEEFGRRVMYLLYPAGIATALSSSFSAIKILNSRVRAIENRG